MKIRVWKCGPYYYPQYKGWFFWNFIYESSDSAKYFIDKEKAIDYLAGDWDKFEAVVWKGQK